MASSLPLFLCCTFVCQLGVAWGASLAPDQASIIKNIVRLLKPSRISVLPPWFSNSTVCEKGLKCNAQGQVTEIYLSTEETRTLDGKRRSANIELFSGKFYTFSGSLSVKIGSLLKLESLTMASLGNISGSIPASLGNLTSLKLLNLSGNNLSGRIPASFANLVNLEVLDVHANEYIGQDRKIKSALNGSIPQLSKLKRLRIFDLSSNLFDKTPPAFLKTLPNLTYLSLGGNRFSGSLDSFISDNSKLTFLNLNYNYFKGPLNAVIGNQRHLKFLDLSKNGFSAPLPSFIGNLTKLEHLDILGNQFTALPKEISRLKGLKYLDAADNKINTKFPEGVGRLKALRFLLLNNNQITGNIKIEELTKLTFLDLSHNILSGFPDYLGKFHQLGHLKLNSNPLKAKIPRTLGGLNRLRTLACAYCQLEGSLPDSFKYNRLQKLQTLDLGGNRLEGAISPQVCGLKNLRNLDLSNNTFSQNIPSCLNFPTLAYLDLSKNYFSGTVSSGLRAICKNVSEDFSENCFYPSNLDESCYFSPQKSEKTCKQFGVPWGVSLAPDQASIIKDIVKSLNPRNVSVLPPWFSYSTVCEKGLKCNAQGQVTEIYLSTEETRTLDGKRRDANLELPDDSYFFSGSLSAKLGSLLKLESLTMASLGKISGPIPPSLGNLKSLKLLNLSGNVLSGRIPASFVNLVNLEVLDFHHNTGTFDNTGLEGPIPQLSKLKNMRIFDVSRNLFNKTPPAFLKTLPNLTYLSLWGNRFSGSLDSFLPDNSKLNYLNLNYNSFKGPLNAVIGKQRQLKFLDLSLNKFSGSLPSSIGNLTRLEHLDLSDNGFSAPLPSSIGNLTNLQYIDISYNQFTALPKEISRLKGLIYLNAADNTINTKFPEGVGKLKALRFLYLGWNQITGEIKIEELTNLTELDLSLNKLSGFPDYFGKFHQLRYLWLNVNPLKAKIPRTLGGLSRLRTLSCIKCQLEGSLPDSFNSNRLQKLEYLDLRDNQLTGAISPQVCGLTHLVHLGLSDNMFSQNIPSCLNFPMLENLYLDNNYFSGIVPAGICKGRYNDLSRNCLSSSNVDKSCKFSPQKSEKACKEFGKKSTKAEQFARFPSS